MRSEHSEKWGEIKALFQKAIELRSEEREAFLKETCSGDVELRSEVESLLVSHDDERPFLETPPLAGAIYALAAYGRGRVEPLLVVQRTA